MIALRDRDTSPVHTFFIGLAYLSGVDVEVDHERALTLITSAADAGVLEAARKLVEMYRSGLGVQRSYDTAILWQEKLILQLEEVFLAEGSPENLDRLFWGIYECGNYYWELRNLDKALEKFTQAMQYLESSPHRSINPQIQRDLTSVYNRIGDIYLAEWDNNIAADYYQKALTIAEKLAQENGTMQAHPDLAVSYNRVRKGNCGILPLSGCRI